MKKGTRKCVVEVVSSQVVLLDTVFPPPHMKSQINYAGYGMSVEKISRHQQTFAKLPPDPDTTGVFPRISRELQLMQEGFGVLSTGGVV